MWVISANWNVCMIFDNGSTLKNDLSSSARSLCCVLCRSVNLTGNAYRHGSVFNVWFVGGF